MIILERYDDAMFDFSKGDYRSAIARLKSILSEDPTHFDAQLGPDMPWRKKKPVVG